MKSIIGLLGLIAIAAGLMACGEDGRDRYKYLIWVDYAGFYTNDYQIKEGILEFRRRDGTKVITNRFEIVKNKRYQEQ